MCGCSGENASSAAASPHLRFFYVELFPLVPRNTGAERSGSVGVHTPGTAAYALGVFCRHVRPRFARQALRFASRFSLFRCVKTRFVATNVFFSVWWGRWWSRGRGGGGLGGSRAPDADPLEKNKGGRRQKNVQNRSRNAEKRQNASCRLCSHQRLTRTVPRTRLRPCAERSLRARSVRPSC